jgi:predicted thioesterase
MPRASGTASMVGLIQWASMEAIRPHLGAGEHSVGLDIEILHAADAPAGLVAHVEIVVERVEGRKVFFRVKAYDGDRAIGEGTHASAEPDVRARRASMKSSPRGERDAVASARWASEDGVVGDGRAAPRETAHASRGEKPQCSRAGRSGGSWGPGSPAPGWH